MDKIIEAINKRFGADTSGRFNPFPTENGYVEILGQNGDFTLREKDTVHGDTDYYIIKYTKDGVEFVLI